MTVNKGIEMISAGLTRASRIGRGGGGVLGSMVGVVRDFEWRNGLAGEVFLMQPWC